MVIARLKVIMHVKRSIVVPVVSILSGVLLQLKALNIFGDFLPSDVLGKLWPLLLAAAALDLLIGQRRLIAAAVMGFFAAALFSTQFMGGWNTELWKIFLKFWPVLLILFGVDCIFAGRSLINAAVIAVAVIIIVYVLLTVLNVPILKDLKMPVDLSSLSSIIPTSSFSGVVPGLPRQTQSVPDMPVNPQVPYQETSPIITGPGGQIAIAMPSQFDTRLDLTAASGKVSIKAGAPGNQFLNGTIALDSRERLTPNASLNSQTAVFTLKSEGAASAPNTSAWDLMLTSLRRTALNAVLDSGYFKADLRGLNLSAVDIVNKYGPIDIMVPQSADGKIRITASSGDIRVYIPKSTRISCMITGTSQVDYPQRNYTFSGGTLIPRSPVPGPIIMEIRSNNGHVQIIESE